LAPGGGSSPLSGTSRFETTCSYDIEFLNSLYFILWEDFGKVVAVDFIRRFVLLGLRRLNKQTERLQPADRNVLEHKLGVRR
jgi:hypothetical protein